MPVKREFLATALVVILCCVGPGSRAAEAKYVEVTAEIEFSDWGYWFFSDNIKPRSGETGPPRANLSPQASTRRMVIGSDTWMMHGDIPSQITRWFTGTNIVAHTFIPQRKAEGDAKEDSAGAATGMQFTRIHESDDGNPGRPVRVADGMGFDVPAKVCWLAFCSAPSLRHAGRTVFPPSDLWKESRLAYSGWLDKTEVFNDGLGLPKKITLFATNGQPVLQYQVHSSTNILGWNFPLEFYGVQYAPEGTNQWTVHLTFKGRVTAIGVGTEPQIPPAVFKAVEK